MALSVEKFSVSQQNLTEPVAFKHQRLWPYYLLEMCMYNQLPQQMGRKCLWQNSKMVINYVQMINSRNSPSRCGNMCPSLLSCPWRFSMLNVCAYFSWPMIFELQPAPMQNIKHFKLHNAD